MLILGCTGWPGSDSHDAAAAILSDGVVIAASEQERFSRRKHAISESPVEAIIFCLQKANISFEQLDCIAIGWREESVPPKISGNDSLSVLKEILPSSILSSVIVPPSIYCVKHHIAHIASAYYTEWF
jgi:carbamoyltransferase